MMSILIGTFATFGIVVTVAALILGVYRLASDFVDAQTERLEFRIAHQGVSITGHDEILASHATDIRHLAESNNQLVEYGRETRKDSELGFSTLVELIDKIDTRLAKLEEKAQ